MTHKFNISSASRTTLLATTVALAGWAAAPAFAQTSGAASSGAKMGTGATTNATVPSDGAHIDTADKQTKGSAGNKGAKSEAAAMDPSGKKGTHLDTTSKTPKAGMGAKGSMAGSSASGAATEGNQGTHLDTKSQGTGK